MTAGYTVSNGHYKWTQVVKHDAAGRTSYARYRANPAHYMIDGNYAKAPAALAGRRRLRPAAPGGVLVACRS
jgi:hypothetical protein